VQELQARRRLRAVRASRERGLACRKCGSGSVLSEWLGSCLSLCKGYKCGGVFLHFARLKEDSRAGSAAAALCSGSGSVAASRCARAASAAAASCCTRIPREVSRAASAAAIPESPFGIAEPPRISPQVLSCLRAAASPGVEVGAGPIPGPTGTRGDGTSTVCESRSGTAVASSLASRRALSWMSSSSFVLTRRGQSSSAER
jgi:hypothetical protein